MPQKVKEFHYNTKTCLYKQACQTLNMLTKETSISLNNNMPHQSLVAFARILKESYQCLYMYMHTPDISSRGLNRVKGAILYSKR